ncbi:hypothetical protein, partial [Paenibacillus thiaminolyticus]
LLLNQSRSFRIDWTEGSMLPARRGQFRLLLNQSRSFRIDWTEGSMLPAQRGQLGQLFNQLSKENKVLDQGS